MRQAYSIRRRSMLVAAASAACAWPAFSQSSKALRILVPYPPGGAVDATARRRYNGPVTARRRFLAAVSVLVKQEALFLILGGLFGEAFADLRAALGEADLDEGRAELLQRQAQAVKKDATALLTACGLALRSFNSWHQ